MRCIRCRIRFDSKDVGNMDCRCHPLELNDNKWGERYPIGHYECCGASPYADDPEHFEFDEIKGCHRIDHVADEEEHRGIVNRPYIIIDLNAAEKLRSWKEISKDRTRSMTFHDDGDLVEFQFKHTFGRMIKINPALETNAPPETVDFSTRILYDAAPTRFDPFCVLRRMAFDVEDWKKRSIQSWKKCDKFMKNIFPS